MPVCVLLIRLSPDLPLPLQIRLATFLQRIKFSCFKFLIKTRGLYLEKRPEECFGWKENHCSRGGFETRPYLFED